MTLTDRRRAAIAAAVFVACLAFDYARPTVTAPHAEAFWAALGIAIAQIFGYIAAQAVTFAVMVLHVAIQLAIAIAHAMALVAQVFIQVYGLLGRFWSNAVRPFLGLVARGFDRFVGWLDRTLRPVMEILNRIRVEVDRIYQGYVRPILDTIEISRRLLQLLARLRIPWARELDAYLAQLEERILAPLRVIYGALNEAMNWVNRIVTLDGYLQRITLIRSLIRYQADALNVWWTSIHRPLVGARREQYERSLVTRTVGQVRADMAAYIKTGDGPDRARIDEHANDLRLRLRRAS